MRPHFIALPILLLLSGCSESSVADEQPVAEPGATVEMEPAEAPRADDAAEAPDIKLGDPVGLD